LFLAAVAFLIRRSGIRLFGPVLLYDLVRTARRRQVVVVRCVFGLSLLVGLFAVWAGGVLHGGRKFWALFSLPSLPANELAGLNFQFFLAVMGLQLLAAFLLTPAYAGGAITREKERQTLEHLLATDLSNREIVLSLLVSRLANLALVFLTSLGVLAPLPLLGGIDPNLLFAGYAALGLTVLSLASLAMLSAVGAPRFREALTHTYLVAFGYLALSTLARLLLSGPRWTVPPAVTGTWLQIAVQWLSAGNLATAARDLHTGVSAGTPLNELLPGALGNYAWFHLLAAAGCTGLAVFRLRTASAEETPRPPPTAPKQFRGWFRPRIGSWPMLWKEIYAELGKRRSRLGRLGLGLLVTASFLWAAYFLPRNGSRWAHGGLERAIYDWAERAGTTVACLMLLQVSVRAAGSISGERDRQTLDALQTSPLDSTSILAAKWLGGILSVRGAWCWLGSIWLTAYLLGGLDVATIPWLLLAWLAFAGFQAILGLGFSLVSRSTLRATLWTLLTTLVLWGGHWVIWLAFGPLFDWDCHERRLVKFVQEYGWTPPMALARLTRGVADLDPDGNGARVWIGVSLWVVSGVVLWCWTSRRFRRVFGRVCVGRNAIHLPAAGARPAPPAGSSVCVRAQCNPFPGPTAPTAPSANGNARITKRWSPAPAASPPP
jgi:ABC-type transport system involved in multi-copper enzyme maturation permease subunit